MLFALRQRQMRPLRTWRHEDAFSVSLSARATLTLCLCVHEYVSCVSVRAITPLGMGRELLSLLGRLPGGGGDGSNTPSMWGGYVFICALSVNV
jgi:hypothetical protein